MTAPRLLHFADLHLDTSTRENAEHAMAQILDLVREFRPDVCINAGDLSMKRGHLAPWVSAALREWHCRLAEIAPTIVVAGNHDLSYADGVGTVAGALSFSEREDRIWTAETPRVIKRGFYTTTVTSTDSNLVPATIACLPYPSRYMLQAVEPGISPQEVNARAGELLERILRGLAAEAGPGSLLVFHGSITGAKTSSEIEMTTDMDVVIPESAIPEEFEHVLCGHIHRHQQIGRAVYAGSPCPLNFGEDHPHGVVLWENGVPRFHELEPKHRMITVDLREVGLDGSMANHSGAPAPTITKGAKVRVLVRAPRGGDPSWLCDTTRALLLQQGASEVRFDISRTEEDHAVEIGDVRKDLGHDELLAAYAKRVPDAEPLLPDLTRTFAEVDGQLSPEARALESYAEYKLHRVACENYKSLSHAELNFDTLGSIVVVEGENGIGKSNLAELESYAVWGKQLPKREQVISKLVRNGAQECWVEAEFSAAGERWKMRRTVRLKGNGVGVGDPILQILGLEPVRPGETQSRRAWVPANDGTASETQKKIEQMVGPHELYLSTRCSSQDETDRLLSFRPAERTEALQAALGTKAFEEREKIAKKMLSVAAGECARVTAEIEVLEAQAGQVDGLEDALHEARYAFEGAHLDRIGCEKGLDDARAALQAAQVRAAAAEEQNRRRQEMESRLAVLGNRLSSITLEAATCARTVAGAAVATEQLARLDSLRAKLPALEAGEAEHRRLVEAQRESRNALEAQTRETVIARNVIRAIVEHYEIQQHSLQVKLDRALEGAGLIEKVPFGEKCADAACPLVASAVKDRFAIDGLEKALEEAEAAHQVEYANASQAQASAGELASELRDAHVAALDALGHSTFDEKALQALRLDVAAIPEQGLRRSTVAAAEAKGRAQAIAQESAGLERDRGAAQADLLALPEVEAVTILAELAAEQQAKKALESARLAEAEAGKAVAALEGKLELLAGAKEKLAAKETERDAARHEAAVLGVFCRAMGREGLPLLILERAIPALEMHANRILEGFDEKLEIETARDLRSGETRSEINLQFRDRFGSHPIAAASGKQRGTMGVALRAALAHVQAETHGLRVGHWIADEPMTSFDADNRLAGQRMLREMSKLFGRLILISHLPEMKEVADTRVLVSQNGSGGSVVEILG